MIEADEYFHSKEDLPSIRFELVAAPSIDTLRPIFGLEISVGEHTDARVPGRWESLYQNLFEYVRIGGSDSAHVLIMYPLYT